MIRETAPAKIILFGEHAVVYGQPAIAAPVSSLRASAEVQPNEAGLFGLHITADDLEKRLTLSQADDVDDALAVAARKVLELCGKTMPDMTVHVRSQIPIASGLGSGAAVSTALVRALASALGCTLDNDAVNQIVYETERIFHGTPSGIDNTVIVYEQPIFFVREQPIERIQPAQPLEIVIGDTGIGASTKLAVSGVRELWEADQAGVQPKMDEIGEIARQARQAIEGGRIHELVPLMRRNHILLCELTVSSPELDRLVAAAEAGGALAAKMSGGGRGGNMIALVTAETRAAVEQALLAAGATRVISTTVN